MTEIRFYRYRGLSIPPANKTTQTYKAISLAHSALVILSLYLCLQPLVLYGNVCRTSHRTFRLFIWTFYSGSVNSSESMKIYARAYCDLCFFTKYYFIRFYCQQKKENIFERPLLSYIPQSIWVSCMYRSLFSVPIFQVFSHLDRGSLINIKCLV